MSIVLLDLPFFQIIFSQLILTKGGCEWYGLEWDGGFVMSCNPELQYKMAIVSMVTDDHSHPQHCLFQDGLWRFMAVHGAESESSSFKESLASSLGYRAFSWCCLSVLGECLSCLLQQRSTWKHPRVGDYKNALQHDKLVNSSWSVVKFDDIVPHLQLLILPAIKCGPYHNGVEMFYSEKAISVHSVHKEC